MKNTTITIVIETPKGSRNKYAFDVEKRRYLLKKVLPKGMVFPYDFGFVPETRGEDGDPLDVLLLHDEPTFPGCTVEAQLIGVMEGEEVPVKGKKLRNDRLLAISPLSPEHQGIHTIDELPIQLIEQLEHFFVSYHDLDDVRFRLLKCTGPKHARKFIEAGKKRNKSE